MYIAGIKTQTSALKGYDNKQAINNLPSFQSLNCRTKEVNKNKQISFKEGKKLYLFDLIAAWVTALFCSIGLISCKFRGANDNNKS